MMFIIGYELEILSSKKKKRLLMFVKKIVRLIDGVRILIFKSSQKNMKLKIFHNYLPCRVT